MTIDPATIAVGQSLPDLVRGPITRGTLALFAGASNDHVLLHIDSDFARSAGMPDVFAHGMLSMAYMGQLLTGWAGQARLRSWQVRFTAITPLHATVRCSGVVADIVEGEGGRQARLQLFAETDQGLRTLEGVAIVSID